MTRPCLGPLETSEAIAFAMPPGATDTHFHIIGTPPAHPFTPERVYTPPPAPVSACREMHGRLGIERAVIVTPSCHGTHNEITLEAIEAYGPQNARGICVVPPDVSDAALERLNGGGVRGLRLNVLFGGGVGLDAFRSLAPRAKELGWHVQLLIDVSENLAEIEADIRAIGIDVVVDHMGHLPAGKGTTDPGFQRLLGLVSDGLAWAKLSGCDRIATDAPLYEDAIPFAHALLDAGPDRMVWGTDWPHVSKFEIMPDDGILLNRLAVYAPDEELRKRVLVDNPARLYGF